MERILKIFIIMFIVLYGIFLPVKAGELSTQQLTSPANVSFDDCCKTYNISAEKLYFLALNSISANRFETRELQSKMGYILFKAAGREFFVTVAYYSSDKSILKITPANNNYYFAPGIVYNIFKYIDLYLDEPEIKVKKS